MNTYRVVSRDNSGGERIDVIEAQGFYVEDDHLFLFINPVTGDSSRDTAVFVGGSWFMVTRVESQ